MSSWLLISLCVPAALGTARIKTWQIHMPNITTTFDQAYRCYAEPVPEEGFITKFETNVNIEHAHHMLIWGGTLPVYSDGGQWNCGAKEETGVRRGGRFYSSGQIIYGSGHDAPSLTPPEGVGYKMGGDSNIQYILIQVHYKVVVTEPDETGVTIHYTTDKLKPAGSMHLHSGVKVPPGEIGYSEGACELPHFTPIHPYVYRVHTHDFGIMVSVYAVQQGKWNLIGKQNPQEPQLFHYMNGSGMVLKNGDILAWRCTYNNTGDHVIYAGSMNEDEMCLIFFGFWYDGDDPQFTACVSPGNGFWKKFTDSQGNALPPPPSDA